MHVRMMIGAKAGEVHDVPYQYAVVMLKDGRATLPDDPVPYETRPAEPVVTREKEKSHGRKRISRL